MKIADLLGAVQAQAEPTTKYVRFWSHKKIYDTSIPIEVALRERTLLAYEFDHEYLEENYGGPLSGDSVPLAYGDGPTTSLSVLKLREALSF